MRSLLTISNQFKLYLLSLVASVATASVLPSGFNPGAYTSFGGLSLSSGDAIAIDTDTGNITGSASHSSTIVATDADGVQYRAFVFDDISIDAGVTVTLTGSLGVAFLSQEDVFVASDLNFLGADAVDAVIVGSTGASGTDGGSIAFVAEDFLEIEGTLSVTGGAGGRGGPSSDAKDAGDGGDGGDAGAILLGAARMDLSGTINADGGEDGEIGVSQVEPPSTTRAGEGGDGGLVLICNDFADTVDANVEEGSNYLHHLQTAGADGSVIFGGTPSFLLPTVWYVDADRTGQVTQDGTSWSTAFADLQDALASAAEGDQVWVAEGVYYPDEAEAAGVSGASVSNNAIRSAFEINVGVYVMGGFAGTETEVGQRDSATYSSILSGDIDYQSNPDIKVDDVIEDAPHLAIVGNNASTVVYGIRLMEADMRLDGFTITAGDGDSFAGGFYGGGLLVNCIIQGNSGRSAGGVLPIDQYPLKMVDCSIVGNSGQYAGGIYAYDPILEMIRCRVQGNQSTRNEIYDAGAARFLIGDVSMTDCLITGNSGGGTGGVSYVFGEFGGESDFLLNGCTIVGNTATNATAGSSYAGGVDAGERVNLDIRNTIIWGNSGAVNANLVGYTSIENSAVEGFDIGGSNLDGTDASQAPDFIDSITAVDAPTRNGDFRIYGNSATRNQGDSSYVTESVDLQGRDRIINSSVDIGAFEYDGPRIFGQLSSFTLEIDALVGDDSKFVFLGNTFSGYDTIIVEYSTAGVVDDTELGSHYQFTAIGNSGDSTEVTLYAVDSSTGDSARSTFTISLFDTYTFEDFRADNSMNADGSDDDDDFSGNGLPNLIQYIAGVSDAYQTSIPDADFDTEQAGSPKYVFDSTSDTVTITFSKPSDIGFSGVTAYLMESLTLSSWGSVSAGGEGGPSIRYVSTEAGYTIYEYVIPLDEDKAFYRVESSYIRGTGED